MKKRNQNTYKTILLCVCLGTISAIAQQRPGRPRFVTDEENAQLKSWPKDCDLEQTPWNSFKVTAYVHDPETVDRTLEISPLTRIIFSDPKLRADDERLIANIKEAIHRIETTREKIDLVTRKVLYADDQAEVDRLKALVKRLENKEQTLLNAPHSSLQGQDIISVLAAYNVTRNGRAKKDGELKDLRNQVHADLGEVINSFPCETRNIRVCAVTYPRTDNALNHFDVDGIKVDDREKSEKELRPMYQRVRKLKIGHCLSNYPMSDMDRETLRQACEVFPRSGEDTDMAYRDLRLQFTDCRDALNAFLDKQSNLPRNERGKIMLKDHK